MREARSLPINIFEGGASLPARNRIREQVATAEEGPDPFAVARYRRDEWGEFPDWTDAPMLPLHGGGLDDDGTATSYRDLRAQRTIRHHATPDETERVRYAFLPTSLHDWAKDGPWRRIFRPENWSMRHEFEQDAQTFLGVHTLIVPGVYQGGLDGPWAMIPPRQPRLTVRDIPVPGAELEVIG